MNYWSVIKYEACRSKIRSLLSCIMKFSSSFSSFKVYSDQSLQHSWFDLASRFCVRPTQKNIFFPSDYYFDILHTLVTTTKRKQICQLTNNISRILNFNEFIKEIQAYVYMNSLCYELSVCMLHLNVYIYTIFLLLNCKLLHHIIVITIL